MMDSRGIVNPVKDIQRMGKKLYPTDTLAQAKKILTAWNHTDPSLAFSHLTSETLSADLATVKALQEKIIKLQAELLNARNERDAGCIAIWDKVKRTRTGMKSVYGDDSKEYELAGGTRRSERKPPRRKASGPTDPTS
jgi:hypothetical protein